MRARGSVLGVCDLPVMIAGNFRVAGLRTESGRKELPPRLDSGLPENLVGQIGSQRDAKLFALISLNHQQDPKDQAEY